jgi:hypothetical protein
MFEAHNIAHGYRLLEDVVMSRSSMLYSTASSMRVELATADAVIEAFSPVLSNLLTGTVIINSDKGALGVVDVRTGVIAGAYSFINGWLKDSIADMAEEFKSFGEVGLFFNGLPIMHEEDVYRLRARPIYITTKRLNVSTGIFQSTNATAVLLPRTGVASVLFG